MLSGDIVHVDPEDVENAVITAACVDFSEAGAQKGLNGKRGWQVVDSPRALLHFHSLIFSLVENVWGWITAHNGQAFAFYTTAMKRLHHDVWPPQNVNSKHLGECIQSERAFVFTNRKEVSEMLGPPKRIDLIRRPPTNLRRKLLPLREVLRRRAECEVFLDVGTWTPATVYKREYGPMLVGSAVFAAKDAQGHFRPGALITMKNSDKVWRVLERPYRDGRMLLRCGMLKSLFTPVEPVVKPFRVNVYSFDGQALRCTSSNIAEPPLRQSKAAYLEVRADPPFYRTLLAEEGWDAMGKPPELLQRWRERAALEAADRELPRTVPPYTSDRIWEVTGNSIVEGMASEGANEVTERWRKVKPLLDAGEIKLATERPASGDELYDAGTLKWRAGTFAAESHPGTPPPSCGIDDRHLNVALRKAEKEIVRDESVPTGAGDVSDEMRADAVRFLRSSVLPPARQAFGMPRPARNAPRERFQFPADFRGGDAAWREGGVAEVKPKATKPKARPRSPPPPPPANLPVDYDSELDDEDEAMRGPRKHREARARANARDAAAKQAKPVGKAKPAGAAKSSVGVKSAGANTSAKAASAPSAASSRNSMRPPSALPVPGAPPPAPAARVRPATVVPAAVGRKPPPKDGDKRKRGINLAELEGRSLFDGGDWSAIEAFASFKLPLFSVAWATLKAYDCSWKQWVAFQWKAVLPIFLDTSTPLTRRQATTWLLSFVCLLAFGMCYRSSTIKKSLMAIRFFHLAHDYENPLAKCPRVWQGYKAIKRAQDPTVRKHPITPEVCDWLDNEQRSQGLIGIIKKTDRYFGIYVGARASEHLGPDIDWDKICMVSDIRPMIGQQYCTWADDFDGVMIKFRGSKTDQYNEGCLRYVGATGNSRCLIASLHEWYDAQPGHFEREDDTPLFTLPDGSVLTREALAADLRLGTTSLGLPASRVGTHSLRVSCATWLYQAGYELEYIKRHGRWVSNVVHVYLWEGSGFNAMAKNMSEAEFTLHTNLGGG